jgi:4-hydroxybenzoate polyprenyltransferase
VSGDRLPALRPWLRLVRLPLAPTAAWDAVASGALALSAAGLPLSTLGPPTWAAVIVTALLVYGVGMAANDLADRERDRRLAPDRPLPSGAVSPRSAAVLVLVLGVLAVLVGGGSGYAREAASAALLSALLYDFLLKRWLVPGALAMGGVRTANAALVAWPLFRAGLAPWPVLLAPTAVGLYSAAVLVWSSLEEGGSARREWAARGLAALAFALAGGVSAWAAGGPTLGLLVAFGGVTSLLFRRTPRPAPPKRQVLEMLLGLYFVGFCLASAADGGSFPLALASLGLALALIWTSQRLVRALRAP